MTKRLVFLDRDGVINRALVRDGKAHAPLLAQDLELLPGVAAACTRLAEEADALVVVTNQPEIARGNLDPIELDKMHDRLRRELPLESVVACPHDDDDGCACRKPAPGMILDACDRLGADPTDCVMVGDRWKDIAAGQRAGAATVLIGDGYGQQDLVSPDLRADSLADATVAIVALLGGQTL